MNRRKFVEKSAVALATTTAVATTAEASKPTKMAFIHHVFFWLKNPSNSEESAKFEKALNDLAKIDVIRMVHVGKPIVTEFDKSVTDGSYAYSVVLVFDNAKDEETYLYHPLHKKFIDENKHLFAKVMVYDSLAS